jgi:hypothetical protein
MNEDLSKFISPVTRSLASSPRYGIHDPAKQEGNADESAKNLGAVNQALAGGVFTEDSENHGDQKCEK